MSEKLKYFIEAWEMNGVGQTVATVQDSPGTVVTITVDDLRALLARQPAAIDKEAATVYVDCCECAECGHIGINDSHDTDASCGYPCGWTGPSPVEDKCPGCHREGVMGLACPKCSGRYSTIAEARIDAAPLANEASKPAAPSVEQDERGAFIEAYMEARAASVAQAGAVFDNDWPAKQMWSAGIAYARTASTSANVAQDSKPITDLATIVKAAYGNKAWISRRDDIPDFLSPTSADYADLKAEGEKTSSWHPDFVVAMYENSRPDKLYTMDQMREYADAFHRSRVDAANVAQGAEPSAYRTLLDSLGYPWLPCPICNGTEGCDHSYPERARAALAAPPAQTALADAQVEAALAAFNAFPCPNPGSISRSWNADQMRSAIDAALAAAQSASGDTK